MVLKEDLGIHDYGDKNEEDEIIIEFCQIRHLILANTMLKKKIEHINVQEWKTQTTCY